MSIKPKKPIKVGFDLDGVLLYNPIRIVRPFISVLKNLGLIKRKQLQFFVPKTKFEKLFWRIFHWSSLFVAPGIKEIKKLRDEGKIEPYIVTARFGYLKKDTEKWFEIFGANKIFKRCIINEKNEQPHKYKERIIKELKLDYFIEDNWDIVNYLSKSKVSRKCNVFWVTNIFDRKIKYKNKVNGVWEFLPILKKITKSIRILFFSPYFYPHTSGITKYSKELTSLLSKKHEVTVLTFSFNSNLKQQQIVDGIKIVRIPFWFKISKGFFSPHSLIYYWKYLKSTDLVIVDHPNVEGLPLVLLARIFNKKVWSIFQCEIFFERNIFQYFLKLILGTDGFLQLLLSEKIFVLSWDYFDSFKKYSLFKNKTQEVFPVFKQAKINLEFKQRLLKKKKKDKWVGFVGRLSREKGVEVLIAAIKKLPQNHKLILAGPDYKKIIGEERYSKKIQSELLSLYGRYSFYPDLSDSRLKSLLSTLDVLALPSLTHTEAFGIVQLEAMSVGTPVVASNIPGVRVPIKKTKQGKVFPPGDVTKLVSAIESVIKNKKLMNRERVKNIYQKNIGNFSFYNFFEEEINNL